MRGLHNFYIKCLCCFEILVEIAAISRLSQGCFAAIYSWVSYFVSADVPLLYQKNAHV